MSAKQDDVESLHIQLSCAIRDRQTEQGKQIIDALTSSTTQAHNSNALNFYLQSHHPKTPFLHAVAKGNAELALYLLTKGCKIMSQSGRLEGIKSMTMEVTKTIFRLAEKPGFEEIFLQAFDSTDSLLTDRKGNTFMHIVAKKRSLSSLKLGGSTKWLPAMMKHYNNEGYRPIHLAASSNFVEFFQLFFQNLQSFHRSLDSCVPSVFQPQEGPDGSRCKQNGTFIGQDECLELLKEEFKDFSWDCLVRDTKRTSLHIAAKNKSWSVVKLLVKLGANVNLVDEAGKTPLTECLDHQSASGLDSFIPEHEAACVCLVQAGANVNVKSIIRYSERRSMLEDDVLAPLHLAAALGVPSLLEYLLNNGADPCMRGMSGKLPVQFALEQSHNEGAQVLLRDSLYPPGFLASHVDYSFNGLLHSATSCSLSILKHLIQINCPLDRPNVNNIRPLERVISQRNKNCVRLFLNHAPHIVNRHLYEDPRSQLPLHLAASAGDTDMCQLLLGYGVDIYGRAYGKHRAYRRALKFHRYNTALYLCDQMSQPFSMTERDEILRLLEDAPEEVSAVLKHRVENVPSLVLHCLDVLRQTLIQRYLSLKHVHLLPVPNSMIKALRYEHSAS